MIRSIVVGVSAFFQWMLAWRRKREREEWQEVGATMQREADQKGTIHAQRDQLKKAANRKRGDARRRLRRGDF